MPELQSSEIKVLKAVSARGPHGKWHDAEELGKQLDQSKSVMTRLLSNLGSAELVHLERPGPGEPLRVQITAHGLETLSRIQNLTKAPKPDLPAKAQSAGEAKSKTNNTKTISAKNSAGKDAGKESGTDSRTLQKGQKPKPNQKALYDALAPHLGNPDQKSFEKLVGQANPALLNAITKVLEQKEPRTPSGGRGPEAADLPKLSPDEEAQENKLSSLTHPDYRQMNWRQRTMTFTIEWDQMRKRRLGALTTYFSTFGPRWQRQDWKDFNLARRQADSKGARYLDWIAAQFDYPGMPENGSVDPADFHGRQAMEKHLSFMKKNPAGQGSIPVEPSAPGLRPMLPDVDLSDFDLKDPLHKAKAEEILSGIESLSQTVFRDDQEGFLRLVVHAIKNERLPQAALDLRYDIKAKVLAKLQDEEKTKEKPLVLGGKPKLII